LNDASIEHYNSFVSCNKKRVLLVDAVRKMCIKLESYEFDIEFECDANEGKVFKYILNSFRRASKLIGRERVNLERLLGDEEEEAKEK